MSIPNMFSGDVIMQNMAANDARRAAEYNEQTRVIYETAVQNAINAGRDPNAIPPPQYRSTNADVYLQAYRQGVEPNQPDPWKEQQRISAAAASAPPIVRTTAPTASGNSGSNQNPPVGVGPQGNGVANTSGRGSDGGGRRTESVATTTRGNNQDALSATIANLFGSDSTVTSMLTTKIMGVPAWMLALGAYVVMSNRR